jgi:hypothetical protein
MPGGVPRGHCPHFRRSKMRSVFPRQGSMDGGGRRRAKKRAPPHRRRASTRAPPPPAAVLAPRPCADASPRPTRSRRATRHAGARRDFVKVGRCGQASCGRARTRCARRRKSGYLECGYRPYFFSRASGRLRSVKALKTSFPDTGRGEAWCSKRTQGRSGWARPVRIIRARVAREVSPC